MLPIDPTVAAMIAIAVAALSEIIGMSSLRANSIIQLVLQLLRVTFPKL
ncbi:MAG: hypothetical protein ACO3GP_08835 [Candidatus Limnocylindrus sp.]